MNYNILYIHSHDTGRIIEPYGVPVPTPRLQALAQDSVFFRSMFCAGPTCSPSRAALLTGQYPHVCGQMGLAHRGFELEHLDRHIVRFLKTHGYRSALSGIQHIVHGEDSAARIGYDEYLADPFPLDGPDSPAEAAARWLRTAPDQPFFLSCGFVETHREYPELPATDRPVIADGPGAPAPPGYPDESVFREDFARYRTSAADLDRKIGVVLDALEDSGRAESTIVLCTTDHGIAFPEMKCTLTDRGIGVMCMMRIPGVSGRSVSALASHIDLFPTLCEINGLEPPAWLQGYSLMPVIDGSAAQVRSELFAEVNWHAAPEPKRAIRTDRYKLIRRFDDMQRPVLPNVDDGLSKSRFLDAGWADLPVESLRLHDLFCDPFERHNLADDRRYADIVGSLSARLDQWMHQTDDPLLAGLPEPPEGAIWNDPAGFSPTEPPVSR